MLLHVFTHLTQNWHYSECFIFYVHLNCLLFVFCLPELINSKAVWKHWYSAKSLVRDVITWALGPAFSNHLVSMSLLLHLSVFHSLSGKGKKDWSRAYFLTRRLSDHLGNLFFLVHSFLLVILSTPHCSPQHYSESVDLSGSFSAQFLLGSLCPSSDSALQSSDSAVTMAVVAAASVVLSSVYSQFWQRKSWSHDVSW